GGSGTERPSTSTAGAPASRTCTMRNRLSRTNDGRLTTCWDGGAMYASIWKWEGDPDRLAGAYETFTPQLPAEVMGLHLALRAPDGLVVVDTCPTREAFVAFTSDPATRAQLQRDGLGLPTQLDGYPVTAAFVDGARVVG